MTTPFSTPSIVRRMACWLYEGMLMFGVVFLAGYLFGTLSQTRHALDNRIPLQIFLFVVFGIYFVWFWSKGQTLAMKTWHIRIVDQNGRPITQLHAFKRYCLCWLWFIPPLAIVTPLGLTTPAVIFIGAVWVGLWAILSHLQANKQFLHDALAGTMLINATAKP